MTPSKTIRWIILSALTVLCILTLNVGTPVRAAAETMEASIKIPVEPKHIASDMIMIGPPVQGIEIQVAGPIKSIQSLPDTRLNFDLDLSGLGVGVHTIAISADKIQLPDGVSIVKLNTPAITINIDREIKKELPVAVVIYGDPAPGYQVAGTMVKPDKVVLRGPQAVLNGIEKIATNPIDCAALSESFKKEITLDLAEYVTIVFPPDPIIAQIDIREAVIVKAFQNLAVIGRNTGHSFSITPPVIKIEVKGPFTVINDLENSPEFEIYVDLKNLEPGVYVRRATIALPVTTALVGVSPELFTVTVGGQ